MQIEVSPADSVAEGPVSKEKKMLLSLLCTIYLLIAEAKSEGLLRHLSAVLTIPHIYKTELLVMTDVLQRYWESKEISTCLTFESLSKKKKKTSFQ